MKVVHLSTIDEGGAYKAAVRISESMRKCGVDSEVLVRTKKYDDTIGTEIFTNIAQKLISKAKNAVNLTLSKGGITSDYLGTNIAKHPLVKAADVVVLHWVNLFMSYRNVEQLIELGKPVIWVLHDMWLLTGGCHYDEYCGQYVSKCLDCQYIKTNWKKKLISNNYKIKERILTELNPVLVTPSTWMMKCAEQSHITKELKKYVIPNPINEKEFYRDNCKEKFLKQYGLPASTDIILYGAMHATVNPYKGFPYLKEALQAAEKKFRVLVVFGNDDDAGLENKIGQVPVIYLGMINESSKLNEIYNIADVFVAPSKQENYANSVLEALSCGVPTVAFDIGGMSDLITHEKSGYLVKYGDVTGLLKGIDYCIENKDRLSENALLVRKKCNSMAVIGEKYCQLCISISEKVEKNDEH